MADALLERARDLYEGPIDFAGQKLAERLLNILLSATGIIAFLLGFALQNIHITLWGGLAGAALTFIVVVPPYPMYNRHPLRWCDEVDVLVDGKKVN